MKKLKSSMLKLPTLTQPLDPQKQATMIEDCIARKPDVIVVNVVDPVAVITSIKKAYDAGIPVITHNANVAPAGYQYIKTFIGADSYSPGLCDWQADGCKVRQ